MKASNNSNNTTRGNDKEMLVTMMPVMSIIQRIIIRSSVMVRHYSSNTDCASKAADWDSLGFHDYYFAGFGLRLPTLQNMRQV